jgi:hypothetical protein
MKELSSRIQLITRLRDMIHLETRGKIKSLIFSRQEMPRGDMMRREVSGGPNGRSGRYPQSEEMRDRRFEQPRFRDDRGQPEPMGMNRMDGGRPMGGRDSRVRYQREPFPEYPPQDRFYDIRDNRGDNRDNRGDNRDNRGEVYRQPEQFKDRYPSSRNQPMTQRDHLAMDTGIPKDFIKSDAATKPGVNFQAKPSEIRYHFYIY